MNREEHLEWSKQRALQYLEGSDVKNAFTSMCSDLRKHEDLRNHAGMEIGIMLMITNLMDENQCRNWIKGFH